MMIGLVLTAARRARVPLGKGWSNMARYQTLAVEQDSGNAHVFKVALNRPNKSNAMNKAFWR